MSYPAVLAVLFILVALVLSFIPGTAAPDIEIVVALAAVVMAVLSLREK